MKKKKIWMFEIIALLLAVGIGAAGFFWRGEKEEAEMTVEPQIVRQEEVLYLGGQDDISVMGEDIQNVVYSSSNPDIVTVNQIGTVIPVSLGSAEIIAEVNYGTKENVQTKKLSYGVKILDQAENYFVFSGGASTGIRKLTAKGKELREVHVPSYHNGLRIDKVYCDAFSDNDKIEKIFLGDNVVSLNYDVNEDGIFWDEVSFCSCPNLREIYIGRNLSYWNTFFSKSKLEKITVCPENPFLQARENVLFSREGYREGEGHLLYYAGEREDSSYVVPQGVTVIDEMAFMKSKNLKKITFPSTLKKIEYGAFRGAGLTEADIPAETKVEYAAFERNRQLRRVTLPNKISGGEIFLNCTALEKVMIPSTAKICDGENFKGCSSLRAFQMLEGAGDFEVRDGVLFQKSTQTLVAYPPGKSDFSYRVPEDIKYIANNGFCNAEKLRKIKLGKSVKRVGEYAFCDCKSLREIQLDKSLYYVGLGAFINCRSLVRMHFPKNVQCIQVENRSFYCEPFQGCWKLEEISVDSGNMHYSSAEGVLFDKWKRTLYQYPCRKREKSYVVPASVKTIGEQAFMHARYLQTIVMGNGVREIGDALFRDAVELRNITLSRKIKSLNYDPFKGCRRLQEIVLPDGVNSIERSAFSGCVSLRKVVFGTDMEYIVDGAFEGCANMREIVFRGKRWFKSNLGGAEEMPFEKVGCSNYKRLAVFLPACSGREKVQYRRALRKSGLHRDASIK